MNLDDLNPTEIWKLDDWMEAAGVQTYTEIVNLASEIGASEPDKPWNEQRIHEWAKGGKNRDAGIYKRDRAILMLYVLVEAARRHRKLLFNIHDIEEQSKIFLTSKACKEKYAELDNDELQKICSETDYQKIIHVSSSSQSIASLRSKVQPAPPQKLFGREADINIVHDAILTNPITIVDGLAGEGKTTLAWFVALQALESKTFINFDWTTDKRYVVDSRGKQHPIKSDNDSSDFFESILVSMVRRFQWKELLGAIGDPLINGCADRLNSGRYLIVVDNLESVENSEKIVRQLSDILDTSYSKNFLTSRALLTSREHKQGVCKTIRLKGLDQRSGIDYIRYLEDLWHITNPMPKSYAEQLASDTEGNPLFLQIALRSYSFSQILETLDEIIVQLAQGQHIAFEHLFGQMLKNLNPLTLQFAKILAVEFTYSQTTLKDKEIRKLFDLNFENDNLLEVVDELITNIILSRSDNGIYSMHSLIRAYLLNQ